MILRIILLILTYLLLGAHFLREGEMILALSCLFIPFLLFIKRKWSIKVIQIFTYGGVLVWIKTLFVLINSRMDMGQPWIRMTIILFAVMLFTLISGFLLNSKVIKDKYFSSNRDCYKQAFSFNFE